MFGNDLPSEVIEGCHYLAERGISVVVDGDVVEIEGGKLWKIFIFCVPTGDYSDDVFYIFETFIVGATLITKLVRQITQFLFLFENVFIVGIKKMTSSCDNFDGSTFQFVANVV